MKYTFLHTFIIIASYLLFSACSSGGDIRIEGKFKSLKQGKFYAYSYSPEWDAFDTIYVNDGKFSFSKNINDTTIVILQYPNFMETMIVGIPGKTIQLKGDARDLTRINLSGSEENELLSDFQKDIYKKTQKEKTKLAEDFINKHPESYASLVVFQKFFLDTENLDFDKIEKYLKLMLKHAPRRIELLAINAQMNALLKCREGKKLPNFKATTLSKENINNTTFKNNWLLVSFWSTWNREYVRPLAIASKEMKQYNGRIKALNICLDTDTTNCLQTARRDSIGDYLVCDQEAWESPLVKSFGIRYMPAFILVDPTGTIVKRNIKEEDIAETLKKYLK